MDWHPTEKLLALPGSNTLGLLTYTENGKFTFTSEPKILHDLPISIVHWN